MNWLKKLFGFKEQSPKETKKEPKKTISSGATIGGYSSAYRGFDFPSSNDNDHYNPLSPTSPFFYGQNHEESAPVQNQEQHHTHRHVSHSLKRHDAKYYLGIETIGGYRAKVDVDAFTYAEFHKKEAAVYRCRIGKWSKIHYFENVE